VGGPLVEKDGFGELGIKDQLFNVRDGASMDKQVWGEDSDDLVIEGAIIVIRAAGEVVSFVHDTRLVHKFEVEFSHLWEVASDMAADLLGVVVVFQI
jgi:hypothetical protein